MVVDFSGGGGARGWVVVGAGGDVLSVSWTNYFFFYKNMINLCSQTIYVVLITFVLFWFCSEIFF